MREVCMCHCEKCNFFSLELNRNSLHPHSGGPMRHIRSHLSKLQCCPRQTVTQLFSTIPSCFPELVLHLSPNCVPPPPNFSQMWSPNYFPTAIRLCPNSLQLGFPTASQLRTLALNLKLSVALGCKTGPIVFMTHGQNAPPFPGTGGQACNVWKPWKCCIIASLFRATHKNQPTLFFLFFAYHVSSHLCLSFSDLITFIICFHFCFRFAIFPNLPLLIFQSCPTPWKPSKHWGKRNGKKTMKQHRFKFGGVKPELANLAWTKPEKLRKMKPVKNKKNTFRWNFWRFEPWTGEPTKI